MDPLSALIFASFVTWLWAKNVAQDAAFAVRGKEPPSARRERERWERRNAERAAKGQQPEPRREARNFWSNAWADAWADADERRARKADQRRRERHEEWDRRDEVDQIEDEAYGANRDWDREQAEQQPMRCEIHGGEFPVSELALVAVEGRPTWACPPCAARARAAYSQGRWSGPDQSPGPTQESAPTGPGVDVGLLRHAAELVITSRFASASMLQRKLRITYDEATELIDRLERQGVIGPADPQTGERAWFADLDKLDELLSRPDSAAPRVQVEEENGEGEDERTVVHDSDVYDVRRSRPGEPGYEPEDGAQPGATTKEEGEEGDGGTVIPFAPREDPDETPTSIPAAQEDQVSGETPNLQAAIAYADGMASTCSEGVASTEQSIANCQAGRMKVGPALSEMAAGQEALSIASGHFQAAGQHFRDHLQVTEAYGANQDAGDKQFVTQD